MKKFLLTLLILCAILIIAMLWLEWQMGHLVMKVAPSPSGKHVAASYLIGNPPYGESVEIYSGSNPVGKYFGQFVYSGECGQPKFEWMNEQHLVINCPKLKSAVIKKAEIRGVKIEVMPLGTVENLYPPRA